MVETMLTREDNIIVESTLDGVSVWEDIEVERDETLMLSNGDAVVVVVVGYGVVDVTAGTLIGVGEGDLEDVGDGGCVDVDDEMLDDTVTGGHAVNSLMQ